MVKESKKVYFVRHGLTNSNVEKRMMGTRVDESLNETGIAQVKEAAKKLDRGFDIIISSPLKRAKESADIIAAELNVPVIVDDNLKERDSGEGSGKTWPEITEYTKGKLRYEMLNTLKEIDYSRY